MPHHTNPARPIRVQRSELAVPATSGKFFAKAAQSPADVIFLDLEDAIAPSRKEEARDAAICALNEVDWGTKTMAVRVNGADTPWGLRDIIKVVTQCPRLDLVLLPKVRTAFDVQFADELIGRLEPERQDDKRIGIEILIETTLGLANVESIAASSPRLEAIIFGVGDYSIELGTCGEVIGAPDPRYVVSPEGRPGETSLERPVALRHRPDRECLSRPRPARHRRPICQLRRPGGIPRIGAARRRAGLRGQMGDPSEPAGDCQRGVQPLGRARRLARAILEELEAANLKGQGAYGRGAILIDMAVEKVARSILIRHELVAGGSS